jgi:copper transport protein
MRPIRCTPALTLLAVLFGALAAMATPASPAAAHAYLAASSPADGTVLARAPELVVLSFTERVELSATKVDIVGGGGRRYLATSLTTRRPEGDGVALAGGTEESVDVVVGLPTLPADVYHLTWRTLSSDDLHTTSGNLVFGVQRTVRAATGPPGPGGPAPLETVLRAAGLIGLSVLIGGAALALLSGSAAPLRRRLLMVAAGGGVLALLVGPALGMVQLIAGNGGGGRLWLSELTSVRRLAAELGIAALLVAVLVARTRGRRGVLIGVPAALVTAYATTLLGHTSSGPALVRAATAVHLLAAGAWAGSVLAATIAFMPALRGRSADAGMARGVLRSFLLLAAGCLALLTVTGLLMAGTVVATVDALFLSPYGGVLIAKLVAVGVAALLGLRTARRLRTGRHDVWRGMAGEAVVLVGVLSLAAALGSAGPARGPRFSGVAVRITPQVSGQVADLVDAVTVRPNRPGRNVISVTVSETRRPALAPIGGVSVVLRAPDGRQTVRPAIATPDGLWTVTTDDIDIAGAWHVSVTVLRAGLPAATDAHLWGVAGGPAPVVSAAPLRPATTVAATVLSVAVLIAAAVWLRRRRPQAGEKNGDEEVVDPPTSRRLPSPFSANQEAERVR